MCRVYVEATEQHWCHSLDAFTLDFETGAPICLELIDSSRLVNPGNSLVFPSQHRECKPYTIALEVFGFVFICSSRA